MDVAGDLAATDDTHLFVMSAQTRQLRQSAVTRQEALDGLPPHDRRLHDEIVQLLSDTT